VAGVLTPPPPPEHPAPPQARPFCAAAQAPLGPFPTPPSVDVCGRVPLAARCGLPGVQSQRPQLVGRPPAPPPQPRAECSSSSAAGPVLRRLFTPPKLPNPSCPHTVFCPAPHLVAGRARAAAPAGAAGCTRGQALTTAPQRTRPQPSHAVQQPTPPQSHAAPTRPPPRALAQAPSRTGPGPHANPHPKTVNLWWVAAPPCGCAGGWGRCVLQQRARPPLGRAAVSCCERARKGSYLQARRLDVCTAMEARTAVGSKGRHPRGVKRPQLGPRRAARAAAAGAARRQCQRGAGSRGDSAGAARRRGRLTRRSGSTGSRRRSGT
jgi:hypothetical protein